jgi:ketosteroid isomerase-like protein
MTSANEPTTHAAGETARRNVEIVKRAYDALRRRDLDEIFSLFSPEIEIEQSDEIPWGGHYKGHDEARVFFGKLTQAITSSVALEAFIDSGDRVIVLGRTQGTANASGKRFDVPVAHVWTLENGLVVRAQYNIDNPTMLAALS